MSLDEHSARPARFLKLFLLVTGLLVISLPAGIGILHHFGLNVLTGAPGIEAEAQQYVGAQVCSGCHALQAELWQGSHHQQAMQPANELTVLADFDDATFDYAGVTSRFFRRDDKFYVHTDGPDGEMRDYKIRYTFGVDPLQQYLVEFPDGRLQALSIAWDTRPQSEGGQRWYHLYPDEAIRAGDPLHWTGPNQNWNSMCAACHTTDLHKNFDPQTNTFATTWSESNVACESCHGPGSDHVAWARQVAASGKPNADTAKGLVTELRNDKGGHWTFSEDDPVARWNGAQPPRDDAQACYGCHARRRQLVEPAEPGKPFLHNYSPTLLEPEAYHADGQIHGEVFEYGSFVQSKMHRAGVTCSNCHEPHSLELRAPSNAVCAQCHKPEVFDRPEHHRHEIDTDAAQCVSCHMPERTYMGVDARRDHSFRVPRPDLTAAHGTPNACAQCHSDHPIQWLDAALNRWYGEERRTEPHFVTALDAAWRELSSAGKLLNRLAENGTVPGIARASAISLLPSHPSEEAFAAIHEGLASDDALVRMAATGALAQAEPEVRALAAALLDDPVKAVRVEAARVIAGLPEALLTSAQLSGRERAIGELIDSELASAERPESHLNLAALHTRMGDSAKAESALKLALRLDPQFAPAMLNLADLYRILQRDDDSEAMLQKARVAAPKSGEAVHALGLLRVRQGRRQEALELLSEAVRLDPRVARYGYIYAVALFDISNDLSRAIAVLEKAHESEPANRELLFALIDFHWRAGNAATARIYAEKLIRLNPEDPSALRLRERLNH